MTGRRGGSTAPFFFGVASAFIPMLEKMQAGQDAFAASAVADESRRLAHRTHTGELNGVENTHGVATRAVAAPFLEPFSPAAAPYLSVPLHLPRDHAEEHVRHRGVTAEATGATQALD